MEPVLTRIVPFAVAVAALLTVLGIINPDVAARIVELAAAAVTLVSGIWAAWSARGNVAPVRALPDGTWQVVSDAAVVGNTGPGS